MTDARAEREDRHGDHWTFTGRSWTRVEVPIITRSSDELERDYGPTREGHGPKCIRPHMGELGRG